MDVQEFWAIVDAARDDDPTVHMARLRARLEDGDAEHRAGFADCFVGLMRYACDWQLWDAAEIVFGGMNDETFFGLRAWLVSQGADTYHEVLRNADSLAAHQLRLLPEFAYVAAGPDVAPSTLEDSFVGAPIERDDEEGFESAFPTLYQRYRSFSAQVRGRQRLLFSSQERASHIRRARVISAIGVVLGLGAVAVLLPWWASIPLGIGFLLAVAFGLVHVQTRRIIGGFVSRSRDVGNARRLVGDIDVAIVYLEPDDTQVSTNVTRTIDEAFSLLVDEAKQYGVDVRFRRVQPDPVRLPCARLYDPAFRDFDRKRLDELRDELTPLLPRGNGFVLAVTTERRCTPTAWHATRFNPRALEFCICPTRASAATIAHEILHLFGARDLYRTSRPGGWIDACLLAMVANDVERWTGHDVRETSIMTNGDHTKVDPLTAVAIGWTDQIGGRTVPIFGVPAPTDRDNAEARDDHLEGRSPLQRTPSPRSSSAARTRLASAASGQRSRNSAYAHRARARRVRAFSKRARSSKPTRAAVERG